MTPFNVLAPGGFINEQGLEVAIKAFSRLYHNITPKHQRRIRLIIIDEVENISKLRLKASTFEINEVVKFIDRENSDESVEAYEKSSVFVFPASNSLHRIIPEALSYGLPVISVDNEEVKSYLDASCGILVKKNALNDTILEVSRMLKMLYFDPEARKILKRGAMRKYKNHFSWGVYERREKLRS